MIYLSGRSINMMALQQWDAQSVTAYYTIQASLKQNDKDLPFIHSILSMQIIVQIAADV